MKIPILKGILGGFLLSGVFLFASAVGVATNVMAQDLSVGVGKPVGLVNDFGEILTASERDILAGKLVKFGQLTGNAIVVATIPSLGNETIETLATKLFEQWGIGSKKGGDNGILILVARDERKVRIEVGYGLEAVATDALTSTIIRSTITPAFKEGKYYEGLDGATDALMGAISADPAYVKATPTSTRSEGRDYGNWIYFGIFIFMWLGSILGRSKSWWLGGVLGAIGGVVIGFEFGFVFFGIIAIVVLTACGLLFDFLVSAAHARHVASGTHTPWWFGGGPFGGFGGGSGGGFGGFGGGRSGGGGASGGW
ncbi:MAG: hypothetical protein RIT04_530 [Candidatus Parcubacteria bacterium]|jgi:uncharacterized protein